MSGVELELDEDDRQWQQWLSELMQPSGDDDDHEDAECVCVFCYSILLVKLTTFVVLYDQSNIFYKTRFFLMMPFLIGTLSLPYFTFCLFALPPYIPPLLSPLSLTLLPIFLLFFSTSYLSTRRGGGAR